MSEDASSKQRSPEEIEADLAQTRAELSSTVNELTEMLDPRRQVEIVKSNLRDAADRAADSAKQAVDGLGAKARAFADDVRGGDPRSMGYLGAGVVAAVAVVTLLARKGR